MALLIKDGGVWKNAKTVWVKTQGVWKEISVSGGGGGAVVQTPTLTSPTKGELTLAPIGKATAFSGTAYLKQKSSVWQIATDAEFESIVYTNTITTAPFDQWVINPTLLTLQTNYFLRVQYIGITFDESISVASQNSVPVGFRFGIEISVPTILTPPTTQELYQQAQNFTITEMSTPQSGSVWTTTIWQSSRNPEFTDLLWSGEFPASTSQNLLPSTAFPNTGDVYIRLRYKLSTPGGEALSDWSQTYTYTVEGFLPPFVNGSQTFTAASTVWNVPDRIRYLRVTLRGGGATYPMKERYDPDPPITLFQQKGGTVIFEIAVSPNQAFRIQISGAGASQAWAYEKGEWRPSGAGSAAIFGPDPGAAFTQSTLWAVAGGCGSGLSYNTPRNQSVYDSRLVKGGVGGGDTGGTGETYAHEGGTGGTQTSGGIGAGQDITKGNDGAALQGGSGGFGRDDDGPTIGNGGGGGWFGGGSGSRTRSGTGSPGGGGSSRVQIPSENLVRLIENSQGTWPDGSQVLIEW